MRIAKAGVFVFAASGVLGMDAENEQQRRADVVRQRLSRRLGNEVTSSTGGQRLRYTTPSAMTTSQDGYPSGLEDARSSRRQLCDQKILQGVNDLKQAYEKIKMQVDWPPEILKRFGSLDREVEMLRFYTHATERQHNYMFRRSACKSRDKVGHSYELRFDDRGGIMFRLENQRSGDYVWSGTVYKVTPTNGSWTFEYAYPEAGTAPSFTAQLSGINKVDNVKDGPVTTEEVRQITML